MRDGPPEFTPDSTWPALLGKTSKELISFVYRTITFFGSTFQYDSTRKSFCNFLTGLQTSMMPPVTPSSKRLQASMNPVWAGSRSLAATREVEVSFFSWGYLDVSVPCVPAACAAPRHESRSVSRSRTSSDQSLLSGSPKLFAA